MKQSTPDAGFLPLLLNVFSYQVKRVRSNWDKIDLAAAITKGIEDGGKEIARIAISMVRVDTGELKDSIEFTIFDTKTNKIRGKVYTGKLPQAMTLEFGTGIYNTLGTSANIPWYVHESMADLSKYNFPTVYSKDKGLFYRIEGAQAHPFMKPAFEAGKNYAVQSVADEIRKMLT